MSNTFTNLISDVYAATDVVSRELLGFIPAVQRSSSAERCQLNANAIRSGVAPVNTAAGDVTPAMSLPAAADQTIGNTALTITKSRFAPFSWSGEDQAGINSGAGYLTTRQDQIAQAMRALVNECEADVAAAARKAASRAYGTAGTTPFATNFAESAQVNKILLDNGAPLSDKSLILNTTAGVNLRTLLNNPLAANSSLANDLTRQGVLIDVNGFAHRESAQLGIVTKGTGTSYVLNGAHAVGATSIVLKTGSGTVLAGDVLTIGNHKYVVKTGIAAPGTAIINAPGLLEAGSDGGTVTIGNNFTPSVGFTRNAIELATRLPALPQEGDLAIMRETITDPRSGLVFELAVYPGYRMVVYQVMLAWGVLARKPEHIALMLG